MAASCKSVSIPEDHPANTLNSNYWKCVESNENDKNVGKYTSMQACEEETQSCAQREHYDHRFKIQNVWPVAPFRYDSKRHLSPAFERLADTVVY